MNEMAAAAGGKRSDVVGVLSHQRFAGVAGIVTTLTVMKLGPWHMKKIGTYVGLGCSSEQAIVPAYRFFQAWIDVARVWVFGIDDYIVLFTRGNAGYYQNG